MYKKFYDFQSIFPLTDIIKWDTSNIVDMSFMVYDCKRVRVISAFCYGIPQN